MLCHGSVRVDAAAKTGPATLRVVFPATSRFRSFPTDIPVVIR